MEPKTQFWVYRSKDFVATGSRRSFPFLPGLFFLALGALVLIAPRLLIAALAGLFFFLGAVFCFVAWKFMQLRKQLMSLTKNFEGKIQVQAFEIRPPHEDVASESKKIVYH